MTDTAETKEIPFATIGALLVARNVLANTNYQRVNIFDDNDSETVTMNSIVFEGEFEFTVSPETDEGDREPELFAVDLTTEADVPFSVVLYSVDMETDKRTIVAEVEFTGPGDESWMDVFESEFIRVAAEKGIKLEI